MNIFEKLKNELKNKLKLTKEKFRSKKYVYLQKPICDMSYKEALKEFKIKEKIIFEQEGNFEGRNKDLIEKVIYKSKDNDLAINYLKKILNSNNISKGIKVEYIKCFSNLYDENELCKIMTLEDAQIEEQYKVLIVREGIEKLPEDILLKYFDYTNIDEKYVRRIIKNVSIDGKITILNHLKDDKLKEKLLLEETMYMGFDDTKKMYEEVILYGYREIEDLYIEKVKTLNSEDALQIINQINYISPKLANELDKVVEHMDVDGVIEYINNNEVNKGSIIYLNRKFCLEDKKKVFYNLISENNRKKAIVIFANEVSRRDFRKMLDEEKSDVVRCELEKNESLIVA